MLSVLAGLIGQSRMLEIKRTWKEPATIWTCVISRVGTGKTPGLRRATWPADQVEWQLHAAHIQERNAFEEALQEWKDDKSNGENGVVGEKPCLDPNYPQLVVDDTTMEALYDIHYKNPRGLLLATDELSGWLSSFNCYRGGAGRDVPNWLSIHSGDKAQTNRKTGAYRIYLPTTAVSVCGTIQPEVADKILFDDKLMENGFAARVLAVQPPGLAVPWSDEEVPESIDAAMRDLASRMFALHGAEDDSRWFSPVCLPFAPDARELFKQNDSRMREHAESLEEPLRTAWLKLKPTAGRFALIFSVVNQLTSQPTGEAEMPLDSCSTQAGIDLAWWFGNEMTRNYRNRQLFKLEARESHLDWIRRKYPTGITPRQLQQGRRSAKPTSNARQILSGLAASGEGHWDGKNFMPATLPCTNPCFATPPGHVPAETWRHGDMETLRIKEQER